MLWYAFLWKMHMGQTLMPSEPPNIYLANVCSPGEKYQLSIAIFGYQRLPYMATPPSAVETSLIICFIAFSTSP